MANEKFILDKMQRNLEQMGVVVVRGAANLTAAGIVVTLEDPEIQKPMGGVDGSVSPFIGMGVANSNIIVLDIAPIDLDGFKLLAVCARFANTLKVAGDIIPGHADLIGMGQ